MLDPAPPFELTPGSCSNNVIGVANNSPENKLSLKKRTKSLNATSVKQIRNECMKRKFNDTGLCVSRRHYMADTSAKIAQILELVEDGEYFTISRPRQYGKTTILSLLTEQLNSRDDYVALNISFEDIDAETYRHQERFIVTFLEMLGKEFEYLGLPEPARFLEQKLGQIANMPCLSYCITALVRDLLPEKATVLLIDEVDKSSNNQLFSDFLSIWLYVCTPDLQRFSIC